MNANELADNLLKNGGNCSWFKEIATMLRQQQAEIDRLTMLCDCMTTESNRKGNEIEALRQQQAVIEMLEAELKAMREQLNANQV